MAGRSSFGHVRERPSGRWQARWQDADGRQHSKTYDVKEDASKWLRDQWASLDKGEWVNPNDGKETFAAFARRWRETVVDLRESTLTRDLQYLDRYLLPTFGKKQLAAIDMLAVQSWVAEMNRQLAPATTVKAAQILGKIMRAAVAARLISSSPVDGVKLPKVADTEMRFLTADEIWRLADVIDNYPEHKNPRPKPSYRGLVLLGAFGGLRIGEMVGLKTQRVNELRRIVEVVEICTEVDGHKIVGPPKTRRGRRQVPIPAFVADALDLSRPDGLVFPNTQGGYLGLASWRQRIWRPAVTAAGLDPLRIHDLRHTAVSLWIQAGANALEVARRAGHSSVSAVFDRYGHLLPGAEDRLTDALEALARPRAAPDAAVLSLDAALRR